MGWAGGKGLTGGRKREKEQREKGWLGVLISSPVGIGCGDVMGAADTRLLPMVEKGGSDRIQQVQARCGARLCCKKKICWGIL